MRALATAEISCLSCPPQRRDALVMALADAPKFARFFVDGLRSPVHISVLVANNALELSASGACGNTAGISVSLTPLRRIVKDYRLICDTYNQAVALADGRRVETVDMGRRAFHNDGAEWIAEKISDIFEGDEESYRYIFTLVNILYIPYGLE